MLKTEEFDLRVKQRMTGENRFLDGTTFLSASTLSKAVRNSYVIDLCLIFCTFLFHFCKNRMYGNMVCLIYRLDSETHVYTEGGARFIYGHGKLN